MYAQTPAHKTNDLYRKYYYKAGSTLNALREQSSDPILWPATSFDHNSNPIGKTPAKESINFGAIDFLLQSHNKEHQIRQLLAKLHMGDQLELENRQKVFEDVIIQRIKTLQNHVNISKAQIR